MSYEKDPHVRERQLCYYFGGSRVPLRKRPSKYSRWIYHPWLEISRHEDRDLLLQLRALLARKNTWIRTKGKLHIAIADYPGTGPLGDRMVIMRARDFMEWFGGGMSGRDYKDELERERIERTRGPTYEEDGILEWML